IGERFALEPALGLLASALGLLTPHIVAGFGHDELDRRAPHERVEDERPVDGLPRRRAVVHISLRPSSAWDKVTSSAYSRSPPTGRPLAKRVTRTPSGLINAATYMAVALPSRLGLVARMHSTT